MVNGFRHLKRSDHRVMPWKNGGGATTEIFIAPPESSLESSFHWRVSLATIESSGPFSNFAGYERIILQLAGPRMRLVHGESTVVLLEPFVPHSFAGETTTRVELLNDGDSEPAFDFNLMWQRERPRPLLWVWEGDEEFVLPASGGACRMIYAVDGPIVVGGDAAEYRLAPGDALLCEAKKATLIGRPLSRMRAIIIENL